MKKKMCLVLAALFVWIGAAQADDLKQIRIPATLVKGFYQNEKDGLKGFLKDEESRCLITLYAFLDWHEYDSKADCLMDYTYIGKDTDGELLWIGLGGKETSMILMYKPDTNPNYFTGMEVSFSGSWIPSFIDVYCKPLYHNSGTTLRSLLQRLQQVSK